MHSVFLCSAYTVWLCQAFSQQTLRLLLQAAGIEYFVYKSTELVQYTFVFIILTHVDLSSAHICIFKCTVYFCAGYISILSESVVYWLCMFSLDRHYVCCYKVIRKDGQILLECIEFHAFLFLNEIHHVNRKLKYQIQRNK